LEILQVEGFNEEGEECGNQDTQVEIYLVWDGGVVAAVGADFEYVLSAYDGGRIGALGG
jgi:hypothetical protein